MIVLIDNYDSFTYNLYQLLGEYEEDIVVVRNDQITIEQLEEMNPKELCFRQTVKTRGGWYLY